jgi:hypothetical protein
MLLFLRSWWSKTYNRPLKDPVLTSYTLQELLYEFFDKIERPKAEKDRIEEQDDKIEEAKHDDALAWAEEQERLEQEALEKKKAQPGPPPDPTKDPENIKWMEEQVRKAREFYGESFGEDISEDFS